MLVLFVGGPVDGEIKNVPSEKNDYRVQVGGAVHSYEIETHEYSNRALGFHVGECPDALHVDWNLDE